MDWETVHARLSQTAIKEEMWRRAEGGQGLRSNKLLVQTFKELDETGLVTVKEGKQKTKLYLMTDQGRNWVEELITHERRRVDGPEIRTSPEPDDVNKTKTYALLGFLCFALGAFSGWKSTSYSLYTSFFGNK